MKRDYGVITLAHGNPKFVRYAVALARSLVLHNPGVPRAIITDADDPVVKSLFDFVIPVRAAYGGNVRQKVHLDLYTPFENSLFIDSDSLVVKCLDEPLLPFRNEPFAIPIMGRLTRGGEEWFVDTDFILDHFGLESVPQFNSGAIWFTKHAQSQRVFDTARDILGRFRELRFHEFKKDGPADEPIFAVSMALNGVAGVEDHGGLMRTPIGLEGKLTIDSLKGTCRFVKYGEVVSPAICHFADFTTHSTYRREQLKLAYQFSKKRLLRACAPVVPGPYVFLAGWSTTLLHRVRRTYANVVSLASK